MKFTSVNNREYEVSELENDFENAKKFENVLIGNRFLFFKRGFLKYGYVSFESLKYAFRRVMVVPIKKKEIQVDYLVIAEKRKELALIQLAGHNVAAQILEEIKAKAPDATFTCPERLKN